MLRPVEVHVTPAIYATLRGATGATGATGAAGAAGATGAQGSVGPLMWINLSCAEVINTTSDDVVVMPTWRTPSTGSYTVHLLNSIAHPEISFNSTTQTYTIPSTALTITENNQPVLLENFWAAHDDYDPNDPYPLLTALLMVILTRGTDQVFDSVTIHRLSSETAVQVTSVTVA